MSSIWRRLRGVASTASIWFVAWAGLGVPLSGCRLHAPLLAGAGAPIAFHRGTDSLRPILGSLGRSVRNRLWCERRGYTAEPNVRTAPRSTPCLLGCCGWRRISGGSLGSVFLCAEPLAGQCSNRHSARSRRRCNQRGRNPMDCSARRSRSSRTDAG